MSAGGNPEGASQLQNIFLQQKAAGATPGGTTPQAYEQLTGAAKNRQETSNLALEGPGKGAESDVKIAGGAAQLANQYQADPSQDNFQAMHDYASKYKGSLAASQA